MQLDEHYVPRPGGFRLFAESVGSGGNVVLFPNGHYLVDDFAFLAPGRTLIFYDPRNRGRSDTITDPSRLSRGILNDVDDLDAMRCHFGLDRVDVIGHSYMGLTVALYAMKYAAHVNRVVQLCPAQPIAFKEYPADPTYADGMLAEVQTKIVQLQKERKSYGAFEFCQKFWALLRELYVVNPAHAAKIKWDRCELPNELNFMQYWTANLLPSIQSVALAAEDFAKMAMPVLIIHGTRDRSAPYGGARDWAQMLPDARLITVENAAHAPWIENPELVLPSIETFLSGAWPAAAEKLRV